jgi:2-polyprenyl-3-methyl-5-hydroxy-6-metoxy-1,4-benzoquinol methylase
MRIKNYFTPSKSTILYRKSRKKILLKKKIKITANFKKYGFDYFDNENIKSGYNKYINDGRYADPTKKIIKNFNLKKNEIICEYGCAKGFLLEEFKKLGFKILGFEISKYAKNKSNIGKSIKIIKKINDIKNYKFDFLISKNVLPHMNLKNVKRLIEISIGKSIHKPYFIIHTFKSDKNKKLFLKWDKTHKTLFNISKWENFLKKYEKKILYSFDILF